MALTKAGVVKMMEFKELVSQYCRCVLWIGSGKMIGLYTCVTANTMIQAKKGKWSYECSMDEDKSYLRERSEFWRDK